MFHCPVGNWSLRIIEIETGPLQNLGGGYKTWEAEGKGKRKRENVKRKMEKGIQGWEQTVGKKRTSKWGLGSKCRKSKRGEK